MIFKNFWSYILLVIVIADSLVTYYIGGERNPLILFVMEKFDLTLGAAMVVRVIYCLPLIIAVDRFEQKTSMWALILYLTIYLYFLI